MTTARFKSDNGVIDPPELDLFKWTATPGCAPRIGGETQAIGGAHETVFALRTTL